MPYAGITTTRREGSRAATVSPARKREVRTRPAAALTPIRSVARRAPISSCTTTAPKVTGGEMASARHWSCSSRTRSRTYPELASPVTASMQSVHEDAAVCSATQAPSARAIKPTGSSRSPHVPSPVGQPTRTSATRSAVTASTGWEAPARAWANATTASSTSLTSDSRSKTAARSLVAGSAHSSKSRAVPDAAYQRLISPPTDR